MLRAMRARIVGSAVWIVLFTATSAAAQQHGAAAGDDETPAPAGAAQHDAAAEAAAIAELDHEAPPNDAPALTGVHRQREMERLMLERAELSLVPSILMIAGGTGLATVGWITFGLSVDASNVDTSKDSHAGPIVATFFLGLGGVALLVTGIVLLAVHIGERSDLADRIDALQHGQGSGGGSASGSVSLGGDGLRITF